MYPLIRTLKRGCSYHCILILLYSSLAIAETHIVRLVDFAYVPKDLVVAEGDIIRWEWDTDNHNVVSGVPFTGNGAFQSTVENTGFAYEVTLTRQYLNSIRHLGSVLDYFCTPHATDNMLGTITVNRAAKSFSAQANGSQIFPPINTAASSNCSLTLNAVETSVDIQCAHSSITPLEVTLHQAPLGRDGAKICDGLATSNTSFSCALSDEQVNALYAGELYISMNSNSYLDGEIRGQFYRTSSSGSVSGFVLAQDGSPISGATVNIGSNSTTSDSQGFYQLTGIANGVYLGSALKAPLHIVPERISSPILVNSSSLIRRNFIETIEGTCGADTDRDTVCEATEVRLGTNPNDRGSFPSTLDSPLFVPWNSFIGMVNIAEISNAGDSVITVEYQLLSSNGVGHQRISFDLQPKEQRDILIHELQGYETDAYGLFTLRFGSNAVDSLRGRMMYYRPNAGGFSFAYAIPFRRAQYGNSAVGFNTFQPSLNSSEARNLVAQWLTVANLDDSNASNFSIRKYSQLGELLSQQTITVEALGRVDLTAGHINPGPNNVGLIEIVPQNRLIPYTSFLSRYGGNAPPEGISTDYLFGFSLMARAGTGVDSFAPISRGGNASNWVEIVNVLDNPIEANVILRDNSGNILSQMTLNLPPRAQHHIEASSFLSPGGSGSIQISSSEANSLIGQSMFYFRNSSSGSIEAMYGSSFQEFYKANISGSYNLYLNMSNWLRISNIQDQAQSIEIVAHPLGQSPRSITRVLAAHAGIDIGIHDQTLFGLAPDQFGIIEVLSPQPVSVEQLRFKTIGSSVDFATPTQVR